MSKTPIRSRHGVVAWFIPLLIIAQVSCSETSGPGEADSVVNNGPATVLVAMSDTLIAGVVGTLAPAPAAVIARNFKGEPVAGTVVMFTWIESGSLPRYFNVPTKADGVAKFTSWGFGRVAGLNVVTASTGSIASVTFAAAGAAGPAHGLTKMSGDGQMVPTGESLKLRPVVKIHDIHGNGIRGATISFAVDAGRGSLDQAVSTSDSAGIATVGVWTLGTAGNHTLTATSPGISSVVFTATAYSTQLACGQQNVFNRETVMQMELSAVSCIEPGGRRFDLFSVVPTSSDIFEFSLSSAEFDTELQIKDESGEVIANNDNRHLTTTNSRIIAILPAEPTTVVASAVNPGATGKYSVSYKTLSGGADCNDVFVTRGVLVTRMLEPKSCDATVGQFGDRYRIYLKGGSTLNVTVEDLDYSYWYVSLYDSDGNAVSNGSNPQYWWITTLEFRAPPTGGYYTVRVGGSDYYSSYILGIR